MGGLASELRPFCGVRGACGERCAIFFACPAVRSRAGHDLWDDVCDTCDTVDLPVCDVVGRESCRGTTDGGGPATRHRAAEGCGASVLATQRLERLATSPIPSAKSTAGCRTQGCFRIGEGWGSGKFASQKMAQIKFPFASFIVSHYRIWFQGGVSAQRAHSTQ